MAKSKTVSLGLGCGLSRGVRGKKKTSGSAAKNRVVKKGRSRRKSRKVQVGGQVKRKSKGAVKGKKRKSKKSLRGLKRKMRLGSRALVGRNMRGGMDNDGTYDTDNILIIVIQDLFNYYDNEEMYTYYTFVQTVFKPGRLFLADIVLADIERKYVSVEYYEALIFRKISYGGNKIGRNRLEYDFNTKKNYFNIYNAEKQEVKVSCGFSSQNPKDEICIVCSNEHEKIPAKKFMNPISKICNQIHQTLLDLEEASGDKEIDTLPNGLRHLILFELIKLISTINYGKFKGLYVRNYICCRCINERAQKSLKKIIIYLAHLCMNKTNRALEFQEFGFTVPILQKIQQWTSKLRLESYTRFNNKIYNFAQKQIEYIQGSNAAAGRT